MSSAAFKQLWLDTDTFIGPLSPTQIQQLRALCEKFYEAGRRVGVPPGHALVTTERLAELEDYAFRYESVSK